MNLTVPGDTELQPLRQSDEILRDASGYGTLEYIGSSNNQNTPRYETLRLRNAAMSCQRDELPEEEVILALKRLDEVDSPQNNAIRDLHYSLSAKRRILSKMNDTKKKRSKRSIGLASIINYKTHFTGVRIKRQFGLFLSHLNLWQNSIRAIEGRFGSSVASYFVFLRRLVALNFIITVICLGFLLIPQLIENKMADKMGTRSAEEYVVDSTAKPNNWDYYEIVDRDSEISTKNPDVEHVGFQWHNLLTGSGTLGSSLLYYGMYTNETISSKGPLKYKMPLAYLFAISSCLLVCLFLLTRWLGHAYKEHRVTSIGSRKHVFSSLAFCAFDFTITSGITAHRKAEAICQEMLEELSGIKYDRPQLRFRDKCEVFARKFCNHIAALVLLVGSGALVWYLLHRKALENTIMVLDKLALSLTITAVLLIIPAVFSQLIKWEGYKSKYIELNVTMIRMFTLLLTVLGVVVYYWFQVAASTNEEGNTDLCWETFFGQEIYRLLVIDFIVVIIPMIPVGYIRRILHDRGCRILGSPEFNLSTSSWYLIYNQMLCWLGLFYFPLVSTFLLCKMILTFFICMAHIKLNCIPPKQVWRAAKAQKIFLLLTFTALLATFVPFMYGLISLHPSTSCGPFKFKEIVSEVILDVFQTWQVNRIWLGLMVHYLTRPGCIAAYLIALGVILLHAFTNDKSHATMVAMLQDQVIMEGKDKAWLQEIVSAATKKSQQLSGISSRSRSRSRPPSPIDQISDPYYNIHVYEPMSQVLDDVQF